MLPPTLKCHCPWWVIGTLPCQSKAHLLPAPISLSCCSAPCISACFPLTAHKWATVLESKFLSVPGAVSSLLPQSAHCFSCLLTHRFIPPSLQYPITAKQMRQGFNNVCVPSLYMPNAWERCFNESSLPFYQYRCLRLQHTQTEHLLKAVSGKARGEPCKESGSQGDGAAAFLRLVWPRISLLEGRNPITHSCS